MIIELTGISGLPLMLSVPPQAPICIISVKIRDGNDEVKMFTRIMVAGLQVVDCQEDYDTVKAKMTMERGDA